MFGSQERKCRRARSAIIHNFDVNVIKTNTSTKSVRSVQQFRRTLERRHNERDGVSNHWSLDCLLNRFVRRWSKKTSKLRVTGLCEGNPPVDSPHQGPATRKCFHLMTSSWNGENYPNSLKWNQGKPVIHWSLRNVTVIFKWQFPDSLYSLVIWAFAVDLLVGDCHRTTWMTFKHWFI